MAVQYEAYFAGVLALRMDLGSKPEYFPPHGRLARALLEREKPVLLDSPKRLVYVKDQWKTDAEILAAKLRDLSAKGFDIVEPEETPLPTVWQTDDSADEACSGSINSCPWEHMPIKTAAAESEEIPAWISTDQHDGPSANPAEQMSLPRSILDILWLEDAVETPGGPPDVEVEVPFLAEQLETLTHDVVRHRSQSTGRNRCHVRHGSPKRRLPSHEPALGIGGSLTVVASDPVQSEILDSTSAFPVCGPLGDEPVAQVAMAETVDEKLHEGARQMPAGQVEPETETPRRTRQTAHLVKRLVWHPRKSVRTEDDLASARMRGSSAGAGDVGSAPFAAASSTEGVDGSGVSPHETETQVPEVAEKELEPIQEWVPPVDWVLEDPLLAPSSVVPAAEDLAVPDQTGAGPRAGSVPSAGSAGLQDRQQPASVAPHSSSSPVQPRGHEIIEPATGAPEVGGHEALTGIGKSLSAAILSSQAGPHPTYEAMRVARQATAFESSFASPRRALSAVNSLSRVLTSGVAEHTGQLAERTLDILQRRQVATSTNRAPQRPSQLEPLRRALLLQAETSALALTAEADELPPWALSAL